MIKIAIGEDGRLNLSETALYRLADLKGLTLYKYVSFDFLEHKPRKESNFRLVGRDFDLTEYEKLVGETYLIGTCGFCVFLTENVGETFPSTDVHHPRIFAHYFPERIERGDRSDPLLIQVIKELGENAGNAEIVEIPDGVEWEVVENDMGEEFIREKHRTWG